MKGSTRFREFRDFKNKKKNLDNEKKRLSGFYDFNKSALISEFSMKDFYSFLDKNKIFLNKHYEEYSKVILNINVNEKINNVIGFDESKMLFASKNFLPKNMCKIYQPIDRTNHITVYDAETEKFRPLQIFPKEILGFTFFPFCRYLNFNGRLFVSGGYQDNKLSRVFWAVEDKSNFNFSDGSKGNKGGKYSSMSNINNEFYNNINDKNFIYEDSHHHNISIIRCADMINSRAGHAMVGLSPSLIMVFGGTEGNKTCEVFHFDTNRWEEMASLNETRIDPSAFVYKNFIYVFFGLRYDKHSKKYTFLETIERVSLLKMQNSEWEYVTPKYSDSLTQELVPRSLCGIVIKSNTNSTVYLLGGQVEKEQYSTDIFEYDFEINSLSYSSKKLPKPSAFLEQNYIYLFKTGINFEIYGDIFYYHNSDYFNFHFKRMGE